MAPRSQGARANAGGTLRPTRALSTATTTTAFILDSTSFSEYVSPMHDVSQPNFKGLEDALAVLRNSEQNIGQCPGNNVARVE